MPATTSRDTLKIAYAGTPDFAVTPLEALFGAGFRPLVILTQPDRRAGRGRKLQSSPVKQCAMRHGVRILQPESLQEVSIQSELELLQLDLLVVTAYGLILPAAVLKIPRYGCWNIHASLLPRWRGAAPVQRAIEAGDSRSGVCIMQMAAGLDTGPVFLCRETPIGIKETGGTLHDRLADLGAGALLECLEQLESGDMPIPLAQDGTKATYANKLEKNEAEIDWNTPADVLERRIRAFNPWPVCWCDLQGERLRIWAAELAGPTSEEPGTIVAAGHDGIEIAAFGGLIRLLEVQRPGSRRMTAEQYLSAHPVRIGK